MKKYIIISILYSLFSILYSSISFAAPSPKPSPIASDSAEIDPETIKENIKKRMREVIKNQAANNNKRLAYIGTISSITTNSITLETSKGVEQASTSASLTTYIELPNNKEIQVDEISIGDYVAALGFTSNNSKVLDARRVLVRRSPPPKPSNTVIYGNISSLDKKKNVLTIENTKLHQKRVLNTNSKTKYQVVDSLNHRQNITIKDLSLNNSVLAVFDSDDNTDESGTLLFLTLKSMSELTINPTPPPSPSPSPKPVKIP